MVAISSVMATKALLAKGTAVGGGLLKGMSTSQKIGLVGSTFSGISGYNKSRQEGNGVVGSMAKGVTDGFLVDVIGFKAYVGGGLLMNAPKAAINGFERMNASARDMSMMGRARPFQSNTFMDSEQIYTMRQAGMSMMDSSKQNLKQAILGSEAQAMHR